jgi:hypothetical protein
MTYAYFLEALSPARARLKNFVEQACQATSVGSAFDDAASAQGLLNFFRRALTSGALTDEELAPTGISREELCNRSFKQIVAARERGMTQRDTSNAPV